MTSLHERDYVVASGEGRHEDAKRHLLAMWKELSGAQAAPTRTGIAQRFGEQCLKQGDKQTAIFLFEVSEMLDPGSLLAKLEFAKFLHYKIGDNSAAVDKCNELILQTSQSPFDASTHDFSSTDYLEAAKRLLKLILD